MTQVQDDAARLQKAYAGEKADDIHRHERAVTEAWEGLLAATQARRLLLLDTVEKFRFFSMVRDLMLWMDGINLQIQSHDSPRCVYILYTHTHSLPIIKRHNFVSAFIVTSA